MAADSAAVQSRTLYGQLTPRSALHWQSDSAHTDTACMQKKIRFDMYMFLMLAIHKSFRICAALDLMPYSFMMLHFLHT